MKDDLQRLLLAAVRSLEGSLLPGPIDPQAVALERTRDAQHGDFASNVAMRLAKGAGLKPRELAERIRADAASLSFAIGNSVGSHNHIAVALLTKAVGANVRRLKVIPFNGSTEGITAMLGGHLDVAATPAGSILPHVQSGRARVLAVAAEQRLGGAFSAVPTWKELGFTVVSANWRNVLAPKGISEEQLRYWDQVFARLAQLPEWKQELQAKLEEDTYLNSRDTRRYMAAQYSELGTILGDLGLTK